MWTMNRTGRVLVFAAVAAMLVGTGCGDGSDPAFSGDRSLPDGFQVVEGAGASFAIPEGWKVTSEEEGVKQTKVTTGTAPEQAGTGTPGVELRRTSDLNGSFDPSLVARRSLAQNEGEDRGEDDPQEVEVPGADKASLNRTQTSFGDVRYDSFDLAVLLKDGSGLFFSGLVPEGADADAILESFRLADG